MTLWLKNITTINPWTTVNYLHIYSAYKSGLDHIAVATTMQALALRLFNDKEEKKSFLPQGPRADSTRYQDNTQVNLLSLMSIPYKVTVPRDNPLFEFIKYRVRNK
jgi:hypothetical protein